MQTRKTITEALSNGNALVCFVTAGDPSLEALPEILEAMSDGGADVIEVGIPFSDPIADGPTIQASSQRALDKGIRLDDIFAALKSVNSRVPIVLMGYANTAMQRGYERFAANAAAAGCSGVILSDLSPEEAAAWRVAAAKSGIDTIFLAAPTSTDARLRAIAEASTGFVYCVSRTGVTGAGAEAGDIAGTVARIRAVTTLPICVGFGISTREHVRSVWKCADGAVVGSAIVQYLHNEWQDGKGKNGLTEIIRALRTA